MQIQADIALVIGLLMAVLSLPVLLNAWTEGRAPRVGAIVLMVACGLISLAYMQRPQGYQLAEVPDAFVRVIKHFTN